MFCFVREKQFSTHLCTKYKLPKGDCQEGLLIFFTPKNSLQIESAFEDEFSEIIVEFDFNFGR